MSILRPISVCLGFLFGILCWSPAVWADCVARDVEQPGGTQKAFIIMIPPSELPAYAEKGFHPAQCNIPDTAAYVTEMCDLTTFGNSAVQMRLEEVLGASPTMMCNSAKLATATVTPAAPIEKTPAPPVGESGTQTAREPQTCTGDRCSK